MSLEKEFPPFTEALELKQLGFDEPCFGCYEEIETRDYKVILEITKSIGLNTLNGIRYYNQEDRVSAPTFSQAFRFFREKYGLNSCIDGLIGRYYYNIRSWKNEAHESYYNTYEEAELACLRKLIAIVKNK